MLWGGVSIDSSSDVHVLYRGTMTAAQSYRDEFLCAIVRPYADAVGEHPIIMHDNARPCTARICTAHMDQQGIDVMDFPL